MIRVYSAESTLDAQMVADALTTAGMDAFVQGGYLSGAIGELPPNTLVSVWIADPDRVVQARQIIDMIEQDLTQRNSRSDAVLSCTECREISSASYTHCWNCGSRLPDPLVD